MGGLVNGGDYALLPCSTNRNTPWLPSVCCDQRGQLLRKCYTRMPTAVRRCTGLGRQCGNRMESLSWALAVSLRHGILPKQGAVCPPSFCSGCERLPGLHCPSIALF